MIVIRDVDTVQVSLFGFHNIARPRIGERYESKREYILPSVMSGKM